MRYASMQTDITAPGAPKRVIDACVEQLGSVDILVNSAGIAPLAGVLAYGRPLWDATVAVNLTAAFEMSYEAAQRMVPQRSGKIINICSVFSFLGGQQAPAYAATKHAIAGLTKTYCDELASTTSRSTGSRRATTRPSSRQRRGATRCSTSACSITSRPVAGASRST